MEHKRKSTIIKSLLFLLYIFVLIYFIVKTINLSFQDLTKLTELNVLWVFIAVVTQIFIVYLLGMVWKDILKIQYNQEIDAPTVLTIQFQSWINKYIPGKVAFIASKAYFLSRKRISLPIASMSILYEQMYLVLSSLILSIPILIFYLFRHFQVNHFFISGILFFFILILSLKFRVIERSFNAIYCRIYSKNRLIFPPLRSNNTLRFILYYALIQLLAGLSLYCLVIAFINPSPVSVVFTIGVAVFAGILGMLVIFAPSGIGITESIIAIFLAYFMDMKDAIIISISYRMVLLISDLIIFGLGFLFGLRKK